MELHTSNGEMQGSFLNPSPQPPSLQQQQQQIPNGHHHQISSDPQINQFDPSSPHDEFLEQMLSSLPSYSWPPPADDQFQNQFDDSPPSLLATKLRQNQISGGAAGSSSAAALTLQQQLLLSRGGISGDDSGLLPLPLSLDASSGDSSCDYRFLLDRSRNDGVDVSSFKSPNPGGEGSMQALFNGFTAGSLHGITPHSTPNQTPHFRHSQSQNKAAPAAMNQPAAAGSAGGPAPAQPRQRVRARRGQATDPHSIAERLRRERIAERMKALQELVPNANKTDKASMLDEIIDYVKFIQLQVKVLSMSRLGGAAAVAPLMAGLSSERGGERVQPGAGGPNGTAAQRSSSNGGGGGGGGDSLTVTEQRVAKLMEKDMGSAMQYLQGKGLCLMPISLATAISTATCHPSAAARNSGAGDLPSSPNVSVLSVQSAPAGTNGIVDASVSKA